MALPNNSKVWLETTMLDHGHGGGPFWEFGKAIWSPSRSKNGRDIYSLMRQVKKDDLVLHVLKGAGGQLAGYSWAAGDYEEVREEPPTAGEWAVMSPYYRVPLRDYTQIEPPVSIRAAFKDKRQEFENVLKTGGKHLFYGPYGTELRLNQGKYLTQVPPELFELFQGLSEGIDGAKPSSIAEQAHPGYAEGDVYKVIQTKQERDPRVRRDAIAKYGKKCMVCDFDFDNFYGPELSVGYIEVHHTKPLAETEGKRTTQIEDVVVVCSNCHRVIHRKRGETLDWKKLKSEIQKSKS